MTDSGELPIEIYTESQRGANRLSMDPDSTNQSFMLVSTHEGYEPNVVTDTQQHLDNLLIGFHNMVCPFCKQLAVEPPVCARCGNFGHRTCLGGDQIGAFTFCRDCYGPVRDYFESLQDIEAKHK